MAATRPPETKKDSTVVILKTLPENSANNPDKLNSSLYELIEAVEAGSRLSLYIRTLSGETEGRQNKYQLLPVEVVILLVNTMMNAHTQNKDQTKILNDAFLNTIDEYQMTPLDHAIERKCSQIAAFLKSKGAEKTGNTTKPQDTSYFSMITNTVSSAATTTVSTIRKVLPF